jgi:hypothetical protein
LISKKSQLFDVATIASDLLEGTALGQLHVPHVPLVSWRWDALTM